MLLCRRVQVRSRVVHDKRCARCQSGRYTAVVYTSVYTHTHTHTHTQGVVGSERSLKTAVVSLFVEGVMELDGDEKGLYS